MSTDAIARTSASGTERTERKPWQTPGDEEQHRPPFRIGIALTLGVVLWAGPDMGLLNILVPQKVAQIDAANKEDIIAMMSIFSMIVSTIMNIVVGALSDRTRSRWGRRVPWLWAGSIGCCATVLVWGLSNAVWQVILLDCVYMVFLNFIVAPLIAVLADRTAPKFRGTISAMYALGIAIGQYGGQAFASAFLPIPYTGFVVLAVLSILVGPIAGTLIHDESTLDMPVDKVTLRGFMDNFAFPTRNVRNYYLALGGKAFINIASCMISGYQLYIFTDYIGVKGASLQRGVQGVLVIFMISAIVMCFFAGPIADRFNVRKLPVIIGGVLVAAGSFVPFFSTNPAIMLAYAVIAGIGQGIFNTVDQALNIEVLPNPRTAAKDLGVLNLANNAGQIFGPLFAAMIIHATGYVGMFPLAGALAMVGVVLVCFIRIR